MASSFNALTLQIHYDNPDGDSGKIDNATGVRIYHSRQPVEHEVGMAIMGDALVVLDSVPIGNGKSRHDFVCPSSCTEEGFDVDEVTVIVESLHMHAKGKRMVSELFRGNGDDAVSVHKAVAGYWDFDQSGITAVRQQPYKWKKGDRYTTTCYYESDEDTTFGLASSDEMCMTFLYYYPKQPRLSDSSPFFTFDPSCVAQYEREMLEPDSNFNREYGVEQPEPIDHGDDDDDGNPNASVTASFHVNSLFMVLVLTVWLRH